MTAATHPHTREMSLDADATMKREKTRVAATSVVAAVALTAMKLIAGLLTGSLGILSEAAHSGLDLVAAVITMFAVRIADRPPDEKHHYGHGKFENLSALIETLLLVLTCVWILYEAYERLIHKMVEIDVTIWSFAVIMVSILVDFSRSRALSRVAKKYHSQALEADALHFSTDIWSSIVVLFGLVCVMMNFPAGDAIAAIVVALIVLSVSARLGKRTIDVLLDRVPEGQYDQVRSIVEHVPGVEEVRSLRIRQAGAKSFIDVVIGIQRTTSFDTVHTIMSQVESAVQEKLPRCDVIVHGEPTIGSGERLPESIAWLVSQHGLTPHNVTILRVEKSFHVDLDIEYPHGTSFADAHEIAEQIETRICAELDDIERVSIHLEEEQSWSGESHEVTTAETSLVASIRDAIAKMKNVAAGAGVVCYSGERGLKVNVICSITGLSDLKAVHDVVNEMETTISQLDTRITKVFVHAEPAE